MAKIIVKHGDWESACAELRSVLKTQDEEFSVRVAESLSPGKKQSAAEAEPAPAPDKKLPPSAPSYQTLLSRRRR